MTEFASFATVTTGTSLEHEFSAACVGFAHCRELIVV
jgi:hypothetical protein